MPGYYGGEPFYALGPTSSLDLIAGQAVEAALLVDWSRRRFGGKVTIAGISLTSFVAQQAASHCHLWSAEARPDAVMLINHSARIENVAFGGALAGHSHRNASFRCWAKRIDGCPTRTARRWSVSGDFLTPTSFATASAISACRCS